MRAKKKPTIEGVVALIITLLAGVIITIDTLTTELVNNSNIVNVIGHYKSVEKLRASRGSLYYDLFIEENQDGYRIGADDADCFDYNRFINEISVNELIKISFRRKNSLIKNSGLHFVVAMEANGNKYLDPKCVNQNLKKNKIEMPLLGLGLMGIGFLIYKLKR